jgi:Tfp pilus assembly protein PilO
MEYRDYLDATERHLHTCFFLAQKLEEIEEKASSSSLTSEEVREQDAIVSNLYYLSGYIVECLYSYAMCKFEVDSGHPIINMKPDLNGTIHSYNLCYNYSKKTNLGRLMQHPNN